LYKFSENSTDMSRALEERLCIDGGDTFASHAVFPFAQRRKYVACSRFSNVEKIVLVIEKCEAP